MKTGEFIRDLMSERGITARELSRRIGVSHVTIGKWLRNDFQPSGKNLETLAAFLNFHAEITLSPAMPSAA